MFQKGYPTLLFSLWLLGSQGCINVSPTQSLHVIEGSSVYLSCMTNCGSVMWYINGKVIANSEQQLIIDHLNQTWAGIYECDVKLANGSLLGHAWVANITVKSINAPENQYAFIGSSTTLNCSVDIDSALISWYSSEDPTVNGLSSVSISAVSLRDDHFYICTVVLATSSVSKTIYLHVIAPPTIRYTPPPKMDIVSNRPNNTKYFFVNFSSRPANATTVVWYKNSVRLFNSANITTNLGPLDGNTSLTIPRLIKREDSGLYTVMIENSFNEIPVHMRNCNISFELNVKVLPAMPTNVTIYQSGSAELIIAWNLHPEFLEENASNLTVQMLYPNGQVASQTTVPGSIAQAKMEILPSINYTINIIAYNIDGYVFAIPTHFKTLPGAPYVYSATIQRLNFTAVYLFITFTYNGGADVTHLNVSYRPAGSHLNWTPPIMVNVAKLISLSAEAVTDITQQYNSIGRLEFKITAVNALSFWSVYRVFNETIDLPGAPRIAQVTYINNRPSTAVVQLSEKGSPPIIQVALVAMTPNVHWGLNICGLYMPGDKIVFNLSSLADHDTYAFAAYASNYAGDSPYSAQVTDDAFHASQDTILPLWSIVIVALVGLFVCSSFIIVVTCLRLKRAHLQAKLTTSHESVTSCIKVFPPLAAPLVPRSPTVRAKFYHPKSSPINNTSNNPMMIDDETSCNVFIHHYATVSTESLKYFRDETDFNYLASTSSATDV
ncbi:hypothetical protein EMCRGX_G013348 [Ephydatia muelleri]